MSNLLHDTTKVGDELVLSEPFGDVVLTDSDQPVVLISAGIGMTPMAGMLSHLAHTGSTRQVTVLHAARNPDLFALQKQIYADLEQLPHGSLTIWYTEHDPERQKTTAERTGPMDVTGVDLPAGAQYYLCGPLPFMQMIRSALIATGVPARDIQYEVFGPDLWLAAPV